MDIQSTIYAYYMKYYLNRGTELGNVLGTMIVVQLFFLPLYTNLARRIGKNRAYIVAAMVWLSGVVLLATASPEWGKPAIYLISACVGIGLSGAIMLPWSMFPDTTDVGELASGSRREGSFSGIMTFSRKVASALAIFIVLSILEWSGYAAPADGVELQQAPRVLLTIRLIAVIAPLLLLSGGVLLALRYRLTAAIHARLRALLDARHQGTPSAGEEDSLKKILL
jgi:oligogalacturonide transporter